MAENAKFTGRLGLESRESGTLPAAVTAVVDTLEDFGHPADRIDARAENAARLQCDHYVVTVRLRRVPLRRTSRLTTSMMQPAALLELTLSPLYPDHCDQEITEILLAEMLRRLLPEVEATSVEWLDTEVALTCEQFLSAFEPKSHVAEQPVPQVTAVPIEETHLPRPRGRACFTPVDETAVELEAHCDLAFQDALERRAAEAAARAHAWVHQPVLARVSRQSWGSQLRATAMAAFGQTGTRRLRFISHLLLLAALILFLDSAGMVQAARPLVP